VNGSPSDAVRGTRDLFAPAVQQHHALIDLLNRTFDQAGYDAVEVPLLEHRDLYLKKSGDELLAKLYHWNQGGRELALRPEWTASVLRAVIHGQSEAPQPARLRYTGPVFRYERPRRATYRQFTQVGLELLGAAGARADAEVLGLAIEGLSAVGIGQYTLTIGHIGVIKALLASLGLPERTTSALTWSLERLRSHGLEAVRAQWHEDAAELPLDLDALSHLNDADIETLLLRVLPSLGVRLDGGGREPTAIVNRLVRKLRYATVPDQLERAWTLLGDLSAARGPAPAILERLRGLLDQHGVDQGQLDELGATLGLLEAHGVPAERIVLDFGMGRGLHYYTGLIFEIDGADGLQLCGGGRYDDLVAALGGRPTPAVGFAYGLERVAAAAPAVEIAPVPSALVMADDPAAAIRAAATLRRQGYRATLDVRGRSLAANTNDARRRGMSHLAVVSGDSIELREL
jgi:histidyl-tRNA synthetase